MGRAEKEALGPGFEFQMLPSRLSQRSICQGTRIEPITLFELQIKYSDMVHRPPFVPLP